MRPRTVGGRLQPKERMDWSPEQCNLPGSKGEVLEMESLGSPSASYRVADRRRKPRIYEPFAATVRGVDGRGDPFEVEAVLDNLSAGGLYMWLRQHVEEGRQIFIVF